MPTDQPAATTRPPDLVNPTTGDRLWFIQIPRNPLDPLVLECELPPGSHGTPLHLHTRTAERFECIEGELSMQLGRHATSLQLKRSDHADVPIGIPHRFWNASNHPVRFRSTVTPGAGFEQFLRSVYALGAAGLAGPSGMPNSPLTLAILRELSDLYFAHLPMLVQRPLFAALSALATLTGARGRLARLVSDVTPTSRGHFDPQR